MTYLNDRQTDSQTDRQTDIQTDLRTFLAKETAEDDYCYAQLLILEGNNWSEQLAWELVDLKKTSVVDHFIEFAAIIYSTNVLYNGDKENLKTN